MNLTPVRGLLLDAATLLGFFLSVGTSVAAPSQEESITGGAGSQTESSRQAKDTEAASAKPWLITPTLSADPKMGTNVGGVIAYLKQLDAESTPSMMGLAVSYSNTDSVTGGVGAQLYWDADKRRLTMLFAGAEINNEYDDFLGTGQSTDTQDSVHTVGFRYLQELREGGWLAGIQGVTTNYSVGADGLFEGILNAVGLSGFDATGIGLVLQHDTMDQQ